ASCGIHLAPDSVRIFFLSLTPATELYPLSLHDAFRSLRGRRRRGARAARRERRREEHALEHPHRPLPARRGRDPRLRPAGRGSRSEEHTSELQSRGHLVCRLLLEKKKERDRLT